MSNRKYIHLRLVRITGHSEVVQVKMNGKKVWLKSEKSQPDFDWGNLNKGSKNLALAICKELYPGHENDLYEVFCRDYIAKLKDSDIVEVNIDITEFVKYANSVIRIKQEGNVDSIEDLLPFKIHNMSTIIVYYQGSGMII